jgi:hypothetical protein
MLTLFNLYYVFYAHLLQTLDLDGGEICAEKKLIFRLKKYIKSSQVFDVIEFT